MSKKSAKKARTPRQTARVKKPAKAAAARKLNAEAQARAAAGPATVSSTRLDGATIKHPLGGANLLSLSHAQLYPSPLNPRVYRSKQDDKTLADSVVEHGILQPLMARPNGGKWEIIMGARRHAAVGIAIKDGRLPKDFELPVRERMCTDAELVEMAGTENMGRADMHPLDEAAVIQAMRKFYKDDAEIIRRLGIRERSFYRRVALLRLAPEIREDLREGKIDLQQAGAYALGKPADQLAHRKEAATNKYMAAVDFVRRAMTEKRIPFSRAVFAHADYDAEVINDPDTGIKYFANVKLFNELQEKAIAAKVKALKKEGYAFVKEVSEDAASDYRPATKGARNVGAIYGTNHDGSFFVSVVTKPPATEAAATKEEAAEDRAMARGITARDQAAKELMAKALKAVEADPRIAMALHIVTFIDSEHYDFDDVEWGLLADTVGAAFGARDATAFEKAFRTFDEGMFSVTLYKALVDGAGVNHDNADLLDLLLKLTAPHSASELCTGGYDLKPLGMEVLQLPLPLADKAAA